VDLGRTPTLGREGLLRVGHGWEQVALEDGDGVARPPERQRDREAPDATAHDDDPLRTGHDHLLAPHADACGASWQRVRQRYGHLRDQLVDDATELFAALGGAAARIAADRRRT
jgi:hypothetical protein